MMVTDMETVMERVTIDSTEIKTETKVNKMRKYTEELEGWPNDMSARDYTVFDISF
jgi:hypothetical protein